MTTNLLAENSVNSVSIREGGQSLGDSAALPSSGFVVVLDSAIHRDPRWCSNCGGPQTFVEVYEFEGGRLGVCLGCGEERVAPFTRVNGE